MNQKAKSIMNNKFEANRVRPGDAKFVYDKQVEFDAPSESAGWDDDDDDDDD